MGAATAFDVSPAAAAEFLGVHEQTLKKWAREGKIGAYRTPGGHWRFRQADLDAFVNASRVEPGEVAS